MGTRSFVKIQEGRNFQFLLQEIQGKKKEEKKSVIQGSYPGQQEAEHFVRAANRGEIEHPAGKLFWLGRLAEHFQADKPVRIPVTYVDESEKIVRVAFHASDELVEGNAYLVFEKANGV